MEIKTSLAAINFSVKKYGRQIKYWNESCKGSQFTFQIFENGKW